MAVSLILFADFLGYGGANARKSDKSEDYEDYTAEDQPTSDRAEQGNSFKVEREQPTIVRKSRLRFRDRAAQLDSNIVNF